MEPADDACINCDAIGPEAKVVGGICIACDLEDGLDDLDRFDDTDPDDDLSDDALFGGDDDDDS